jgi:hypothetical protein
MEANRRSSFQVRYSDATALKHGVNKRSELGSSHHFQLLSQNPMQPNEQSKCGYKQNHCVKRKHANFESEITFLQAEEHVGFFAAAIIVLFHLSL